MKIINRRDAFKGLGVLGATAMLPSLGGSSTPRTAIVVGSGIAGLSAAWELQAAGFAVSVFEKQHMAGGRMRMDWIGPIYRQVHAEEIWEGNLEMLDLADTIRIADKFTINQPDGPMEIPIPVNNGDGIYGVATRFHTTEILNTPGFSNKLKQDLLQLLPDLAEIRETVDPCLLHTGAAWDDESLFDYLAGKLGREGAQRFTDDWVAPGWLWVWGQKAAEASKIAMLSLVAQQNKRWINPPDIGLMTQTLASMLDVKLNTTVMRITPPDANGRHTIHYLTPDGQRTSVTPDVVVCATEGNYVLPMVQGLNDQQRNFFHQVHLGQFAFITYLLKKGHGPKTILSNESGYTASHPEYENQISSIDWVAVPEGTSMEFLGTDPEDRAMVGSYLRDNEMAEWRESGQSLSAYCLPMIQEGYPGLTLDMIDDVVVQGGDELVMFNTGLPSAMAEFIRAEEKDKHGLYFCGEYLSHAHTGAACASGRTVARTIARHWF